MRFDDHSADSNVDFCYLLRSLSIQASAFPDLRLLVSGAGRVFDEWSLAPSGQGRPPMAGPRIRRHAAAAHQIERARMSSPLAAVRLSIASGGSSSTADPSVDTSNPLRRHLSWMASA